MPSQVIRTFHYDPAAHELHIVFRSGRQYRYADVPESVYQAMKATLSKGEFFNTRIRGHYRFVRAAASSG